MTQSALHVTGILTEPKDLHTECSHFDDSPDRLVGFIREQVKPDLKGVERIQMIGSLLEDVPAQAAEQLKGVWELFLKKMIEYGASDMDCGAGGCAGQVWYRIHGVKRPETKFVSLSDDFSDAMILKLLSERQRNIQYEEKNIDFSHEWSVGRDNNRFRADAYFEIGHLALNMRRISNDIRQFEELGLHQSVANLLNLKTNKQGLTLITGIAGSGKSSTLDSIIDVNNRSVSAHIVIIGAPVRDRPFPGQMYCPSPGSGQGRHYFQGWRYSVSAAGPRYYRYWRNA